MAVPTWVLWGSFVEGTGAVSPGIPSGTASGDLMLLFVESYGEGTVATPSGWTATSNSTGGQTTGTTRTMLSLFYKVAGSSESAPSVADTGDHTMAIIHSFRGVNTGVAPTYSFGNGGTGTTTSPSVPSYSVTNAPSLVVVAIACGFDVANTTHLSNFTNSTLVGWTTRSGNQRDSGNGGGLWVGTGRIQNDGGTGTTTGTFASASAYAYVTVSLEAPTGTTENQTDDEDLTDDFTLEVESMPGAMEPIGLTDSLLVEMPKSSDDTGTSVEASSIVVSLSSSDTGSGLDEAIVSIADVDTGSGADTEESLNILSDDTVSAVESEDAETGGVEESDTGSFAETESVSVTLSSSDTAAFTDFGDTDQPDPVVLGDYTVTLVMGPATVWIADYGTAEPTDTDDLTGVYSDLGTSLDGITLTVKQDFDSPEVMQEPNPVASRLKKRELTVECKLAQPTLTNLLYALNHGSVTSGSGYESYEPPMIDRATPLTYRTVIIDGWAPGFNAVDRHKKRRLVLRRCISTQGADMAYSKDKLTVYNVKWDVHRVDEITTPFKIIDEL